MSTVTIRQVFNVNGVPTDVTSFVLSDAAGVYGVKRNDTGTLVVAGGTAMTWVATGTYEYTFTAPTAGLTYTAYYRITTITGTVYQLQDSITDTTSDEVAMPALTGDNLVDTYNSLVVERLRVARDGPKVTYLVDSQRVDWNQYMEVLEKRILAIRKEIAQSQPVEFLDVAYG